MAKLNRIAMDLIQKSNKPENLKGIVAKGYAFDYAEYLVDKGLEIPQIIIDYIVKDTKERFGYSTFHQSKQPKIFQFILKMKEKGLKVPDSFIEMIAEDPNFSQIYIIDLIKNNLLDKIESKIYQALTNGNRIKFLLLKMEEEGVLNYSVFPVKILKDMLDLLTWIGSEEHIRFTNSEPDEDASYFCADILDHLMTIRAITSFDQIDPETLKAIKTKNSIELFVNSLKNNKIKHLPNEMDDIINEPTSAVRSDPYGERVKRLVDAFINYKKSTSKLQESFSSWFKKRY